MRRAFDHSAITTKYILSFSTVVLSVLLLLIPVFRIAYQTGYEIATNEILRRTEKAALELEHELSVLYSLDYYTVFDTQSLLKVTKYHDMRNYERNMPSSATALAANRILKDLKAIHWQLPNAERIFTLFTNNSIALLSDSGVYYDGYPKSTQDIVKSYQALCEHNGALLTGNEDHLVFIIRRNTSSMIMGAVYNEKNLYGMLGLYDLPEGSYFTIEQDDRILFSSHQTDEIPYVNIGANSQTMQFRLTVGVPQSYFAALVMPVYGALSRSLVIAFILSILIAIGMALISAYPICKLVHKELSNGSTQETHGVNELQALESLFAEKNSNIEQKDQYITQAATLMRESIRSHTFLELLLGVVRENSTELLPELSCVYQIAVLQLCAQDHRDISAIEVFKAIGMLCVRIRKNHVIVCVLESQKESFLLALGELNAHLSQQAHIQTLLSRRESGCNRVRAAYLSTFSLHAELGGLADGQWMQASVPCVLSQSDLLRLTGLIRAGEVELVHSFFADEILSDTRKPETVSDMRGQYEQLRLMLIQNALTADNEMLPGFEENADAEAQLLRIRNTCKQIAAQLRRRAGSGAKHKAAVIDYINENFCDSGICVDTVASRFGISGRQVYTIVREQAGVGFGEYLLQLRMEKAAELLKTQEIGSVVTEIGFSSVSAFYRAFKRKYGVTPGQYASQDGTR